MAKTLVRTHGKYRLKPFLPILEAVLTHFGDLEKLAGKHVLELGPGNLVGMMRFLKTEAALASIEGLGKAVSWPWTRQKAFIAEHVKPVFMLDALRKMPKNHYDLVYSRRVMEQHSIDPWILLTSNRYWRRFGGEGFKNLGEDYPASRPNIEAIFTEVHRVMKPGGLIVSEIGRRRFSCLDPAFLEQFGLHKMEERSLGRISSLVTAVKA